MRKISFVSKGIAMSIEPKDNMAIISITEPLEHVKLSDNWKYKLSLCFHDADKQPPVPEEEHGYLFDQYVLFSEEDAKNVIKFYESLPNDIQDIYVHCHAGISRSAAVAKALCDIYKIPNSYDKYNLHNKRVYSMIKIWYNTNYYDEVLE